MASDATVATPPREFVSVETMRIYRVLLAPWVATPRAARWLFIFVLSLVVLGDVLGHVYGAAPRAWPFDAIMLGIANAAWWLLLMPNGLLLALAARRLRLPMIGRDVLWSLPLYAALGIGVPMLCGFPQGHVLSTAVAQLLVAVAVMLFLVMPYYLGLTSYFLFILFHRALGHMVSIPAPSDPRFVIWGSTLGVVLLALLAWRWRQLLRGNYAVRGLRAPSLINFRRSLVGAQSDTLTDARSMRVRPDWMLARPDLTAVGPRAPHKSLRIALGGCYLPQTLVSHLYRWLPAVLILATMALVFFIVTFGDESLFGVLDYVLGADGFRAMSWVLPVFSVMVVVLPVELLAQRWGQVNAELPLLGLLPGLGEVERSKQALLHTAMGQPALRLGLLLLLGLFSAAMLAVGWPVAWALLTVTLGCLGYLYAMALSTFGGRPLSNFGKGLLMIVMFVLFSLTVLLSQPWQGENPLYAAHANVALVAVWLVLALFLLWLGRRGWRALQQRPHPFLPN